MPDKRITVWVQRFKDRPTLMLQWIDPDTGRRKSKSAETADEKAAEDRRVDLEADLNAGRYAEASRMSWEGFRELFEEEYLPGSRQNTLENYQDMFDLFERLCHPKKLRSVSERTVSTFVGAMRREPVRGRVGLAPSTIKQRLQLLHAALQWAADQKLIPGVPKFPSVKVPKKRPQPVPAESFERLLLKAPDDNLRAYLLCGWLAGLRLAEAAALEWERTEEAPYLDLEQDRVVLPAEFVKATEDQWVPLDPVLKAALLALPRHGRKVFRFVDGRRGRGERPVGVNAISERVIRLARKAGVKLTMRALRRGFGCRYAGKVPAQVLQRLLRHSNISITMGFYANVDDAVREAVLGPQRNSPRNSAAEGGADATRAPDATPSPEGPLDRPAAPPARGC
jgi:integrase